MERLLSMQLQNALIDHDIDLTVEQWRLLFYLWMEDDINQQELAQVANKEKSTITRQISALEAKGFIERRSQSNDKRNKNIVLTARGRTIESDALGLAREITAAAEQGIDPEELRIFKNVIKQLITNIQAYSQVGQPA